MEKRKMGRPTLDTVVSFDGAVLGAHPLARGESLTVGPAGARVDYPIEGLADTLAVASHGTVPTLRFPSESTGEVTLADGSRRSLQQLKEAGLCQQGQGDWTYALPSGARAALRIGTLDIGVAPGELPGERLPRAARLDLGPQRYLLGSFLLHGVVLALAILAPPDPRALASQDLSLLDNATLQSRFIPVVPAVPEVHDKSRLTDAGGTFHPVAPGPAGRTGEVRSPRHTLAQSRTAQPPSRRGDDLTAEVKNTGLLAILNATRGDTRTAAVFDRQRSALGDDSQAVLASLGGRVDRDGWGTHGQSVVSTRSGGDCTGPECGTSNSTIAVSLDRICPGGRCGSGPGGPGGHGPGPLFMRAHHPEAPDPVADPVRLTAGMDRSIVRRIIRSRMNEFRYCYERELVKTPELSGRVVVSFVIGRDGKVVSAATQASTMKDPAVGQCVAGAVQRLSFPQPDGASLVQVSYPFVFQSVGALDRHGSERSE